jgi:hypothetical protein
LNHVLAISLDSVEGIFAMIVVVAAIVGPIIEQARRKKQSDSTDSLDEPETPAAPTERREGEPEVIEIKLPTGQVIARIPRDRLDAGTNAGPIQAPPPLARPAPTAPIARPQSAPDEPPRRLKRKAPRPPEQRQRSPGGAPTPESDRYVANLEGHRLVERDLTDLDESRKLGQLDRGPRRGAGRAARRRQTAINVRQAVIWSEILNRPIALREPPDPFAW